MPKLLYHYMVVYSFPNGNGRMEIITQKRIKRYEDIERMDRTVREHNGFQAVVTYYKFLNISIEWR